LLVAVEVEANTLVVVAVQVVIENLHQCLLLFKVIQSQ
jgi:hypothetical protein